MHGFVSYLITVLQFYCSKRTQVHKHAQQLQNEVSVSLISLWKWSGISQIFFVPCECEMHAISPIPSPPPSTNLSLRKSLAKVLAPSGFS